MAWANIPDTDIDTDSPITVALMTAIRDNIETLTPVGEIIDWPHSSTPPSQFLECDGSAVSRTTYANLFAAIGTVHGVGDGSTTFNLPDRRGEFVRGWDHGRGADPDRASRTDRGDGTTGDNNATKQSDQYKSHNHAGNFSYGSGSGGAAAAGVTPGYYGPISGNVPSSGGNETRPRNVNTMYCIRY